jgi:hypothetical protein
LETTIVERPRQLPWGLRKLASAKGVSEIQLVATALANHPTFEGAAAELGCSREALLKYRRILRIEVRNAE